MQIVSDRWLAVRPDKQCHEMKHQRKHQVQWSIVVIPPAYDKHGNNKSRRLRRRLRHRLRRRLLAIATASSTALQATPPPTPRRRLLDHSAGNTGCCLLDHPADSSSHRPSSPRPLRSRHRHRLLAALAAASFVYVLAPSRRYPPPLRRRS